MRRIALTVLPFLSFGAPVAAQRPQARPAAAVSAPIADVGYTVQFDSATASRRLLRVSMSFRVTGRDPVLLSLPAWTPGAYELSYFARKVVEFRAEAGGRELTWDRADPDTWRIVPNGAGEVTVSFAYVADMLDNAAAWSRADFAFFNGTNVLPYPEGRPADFAATVRIVTDPRWQVATGMAPADSPRTYRATNYHDLADMPFFVGRMDVDSAQAVGKWVRLATYPAGLLQGPERARLWEQIQRMIPPMVNVFGETPFDSYTNLVVFDSTLGGGSALEHQNSHVGIYTPFIIGHPMLPSITAHEIFHVWNVKRMRPADMVPYQYDRAQPTTWLWVSEGITDYYADLALVRGGIVDSAEFLQLTGAKMSEVAQLPPIALEDASLATWIDPVDGTRYVYYPKGSLAGLMLDVMIRDASDNKRSLDDVMRDVYQATYKSGRGFTADDWWGAVGRAAGGKSFTEVNAKYIDGREPFPWATVLAVAGLRLHVDSIREPRMGVVTQGDSNGVVVVEVEPASPALAAGIRTGDYLERVGDIPVNDPMFGTTFRARYGRTEGEQIPVVVRRGAETLTLTLQLQFAIRTQSSVVFDRNASPKALRIRKGILTGTTG